MNETRRLHGTRLDLQFIPVNRWVRLCRGLEGLWEERAEGHRRVGGRFFPKEGQGLLVFLECSYGSG